MNGKQWLSMTLVILGVLMASTSQLTDLLGPTLAHTIVAVAGMANSILAGILGVLTSQSGILKDTQAMPGVDRIVVNAQANKTLATLAVDPAQDKIEAAPNAAAAVKATANS